MGGASPSILSKKTNSKESSRPELHGRKKARSATVQGGRSRGGSRATVIRKQGRSLTERVELPESDNSEPTKHSENQSPKGPSPKNRGTPGHKRTKAELEEECARVVAAWPAPPDTVLEASGGTFVPLPNLRFS